MAPQPPNILNAGHTPPAQSQPVRPAQRSRLSWLRVLPLLARPLTQTMPWATLLAGCLAGTVYLAILASLTSNSQPLDQGNVRLAFLPAVAALAFVPHAPFRPLTQTTPVPAWLSPVGHLLLAAPIVAVACWVQLRIIAHTIPPHTIGHPPAIYPVIAQLTGWCAVAVAAAGCVDRSRYADLGGAVAAPVSFAAIALAWYAPIINGFFAEPPGTPHGVTIAWYAVATAASALTCVAMRDQWHRYSRRLHRPPAEHSPS
ncbi:hypothetical protein [Rugosimonospora africana]|uniref:hypothetical protein n=1 Tax=Rugosimonospora africana TaxID=556532 RepID=UPI0019453A97|nr:hypothetical protein [Rugosimonospora africana]